MATDVISFDDFLAQKIELDARAGDLDYTFRQFFNAQIPNLYSGDCDDLLWFITFLDIARQSFNFGDIFSISVDILKTIDQSGLPPFPSSHVLYLLLAFISIYDFSIQPQRMKDLIGELHNKVSASFRSFLIRILTVVFSSRFKDRLKFEVASDGRQHLLEEIQERFYVQPEDQPLRFFRVDPPNNDNFITYVCDQVPVFYYFYKNQRLFEDQVRMAIPLPVIRSFSNGVQPITKQIETMIQKGYNLFVKLFKNSQLTTISTNMGFPDPMLPILINACKGKYVLPVPHPVRGTINEFTDAELRQLEDWNRITTQLAQTPRRRRENLVTPVLLENPNRPRSPVPGDHNERGVLRSRLREPNRNPLDSFESFERSIINEDDTRRQRSRLRGRVENPPTVVDNRREGGGPRVRAAQSVIVPRPAGIDVSELIRRIDNTPNPVPIVQQLNNAPLPVAGEPLNPAMLLSVNDRPDVVAPRPVVNEPRNVDPPLPLLQPIVQPEAGQLLAPLQPDMVPQQIVEQPPALNAQHFINAPMNNNDRVGLAGLGVGDRVVRNIQNGLVDPYQRNFNRGRANQGQVNQGQANQGQANQVQANQVQANQAQANQVQANQVQANQVQANQGQANQGQADQGQADQGQAAPVNRDQANLDTPNNFYQRAPQAVINGNVFDYERTVDAMIQAFYVSVQNQIQVIRSYPFYDLAARETLSFLTDLAEYVKSGLDSDAQRVQRRQVNFAQTNPRQECSAVEFLSWVDTFRMIHSAYVATLVRVDIGDDGMAIENDNEEGGEWEFINKVYRDLVAPPTEVIQQNVELTKTSVMLKQYIDSYYRHLPSNLRVEEKIQQVRIAIEIIANNPRYIAYLRSKIINNAQGVWSITSGHVQQEQLEDVYLKIQEVNDFVNEPKLLEMKKTINELYSVKKRTSSGKLIRDNIYVARSTEQDNNDERVVAGRVRGQDTMFGEITFKGERITAASTMIVNADDLHSAYLTFPGFSYGRDRNNATKPTVYFQLKMIGFQNIGNAPGGNAGVEGNAIAQQRATIGFDVPQRAAEGAAAPVSMQVEYFTDLYKISKITENDGVSMRPKAYIYWVSQMKRSLFTLNANGQADINSPYRRTALTRVQLIVSVVGYNPGTLLELKTYHFQPGSFIEYPFLKGDYLIQKFTFLLDLISKQNYKMEKYKQKIAQRQKYSMANQNSKMLNTVYSRFGNPNAFKK